MCEPATLTMISLGIAAASAAASYVSGTAAAKTQSNNIKVDAAMKQNDMARQADQLHDQAAEEVNAHSRQSMKDMALFDVVTGEYGGGNTADRAGNVATLQNSEQLATLSNNAGRAQAENAFGASAAASRATGQLASVSSPSLFGTALTIGGAAIGAKTQLNTINAKKTTP